MKYFTVGVLNGSLVMWEQPTKFDAEFAIGAMKMGNNFTKVGAAKGETKEDVEKDLREYWKDLITK